MFNDVETLKLLIEYKANLEIKNTSGRAALFLACIHDNSEIIQILLEKGVDKE